MKASAAHVKTAGAAGALYLCLLILAPSAPAAAIAITATADKTEATLDDYIVLQVAVEGTREEPSLPEMSAFNVQSRGTSSQMTIVNGKISSKLEYTYILYPQKPGSFRIGPFTLRDGSRTVSSNQITLTISQAPPQQQGAAEIFVTASVDNEYPHLNEQITYTFQFCRRVKVASASLTEQPSFDGFLSESLGKEREFQKVINGRQYLVTEIRQALFPLKTGEIEISPTTLRAAVVTQGRRNRRGNPFFGDSFFGFTETVPKLFRTDPIRVAVRPLPADGRPADFTNLVGRFTMTSSLSAGKARVGDSLTLTITVNGTGLLKNLQTLAVGPLEGFKVYDDKPVFKPWVTGGKAGGTLTIKKALVPLAAGELKVPAARLSFFDPEADGYKTITSSPYVVQVSPASAGETLELVQSPGGTGPYKQEVKLLGRDLLPIHTGAEALRGAGPSLHPAILLVLLLLPPAGFGTLFFFKRFRDRLAGDPGARRQKHAYRIFLKNAGVAQKAIEDESRFYQAGATALKEFLGDTLNVAGQALTASDLESLLAGKVPPDVLQEIKIQFDLFDSGRFGFKQYSTAERKAVLDAMRKHVRHLNRVMRK